MPIITFTTDWNNSDYYHGAVKGAILSSCPDVTFVDISHNIHPFNILQASIVLRYCYKNFPEGTIHLIEVNNEKKNQPYLLVEKNKQYFIASDSGVYSLLFDDMPDAIVKLNGRESGKDSTFPSLDIFTRAICKLVNNESLEKLGELVTSLPRRAPLLPAYDEAVINGSVIYIDSYANAITNISEELFNKIGKKRRFEIFVQSNHYRINKISDSYSHVPPGELVAVFNSANMLEVAINQGNAAQLLNLDTNSVIRIKFYENSGNPELTLFSN